MPFPWQMKRKKSALDVARHVLEGPLKQAPEHLLLPKLNRIWDNHCPLQGMPQIDFAEPLAEESCPTIMPENESRGPDAAPVFVGPSRFRSTRPVRSERANILFAGIMIAGGLFCAFYFFNGVELARTALAWPGEHLYPRQVSPGRNMEVADNGLPNEAPLPVVSPERHSSRTDPSGDPFPRAAKLITLDRPVGSFPRGGGGLTAGSPSPVLPPPFFRSAVHPSLPALRGGAVGGLPGPGTLISRLPLLLPGEDALTQSLRALANAPEDIVVTLRHDARY